MKPRACLLLLSAALLLSACGGSSQTASTTTAQDSPDKLWSAYVTALPKADAKAVCALFTDGGAKAFAQAWEMSDCAAAVPKAAAEIDDPGDFAARHATPHTKDTANPALATMTACGVGSLTAQHGDDGWLLADYGTPDTVGYCGG